MRAFNLIQVAQVTGPVHPPIIMPKTVAALVV